MGLTQEEWTPLTTQGVPEPGVSEEGLVEKWGEVQTVEMAAEGSRSELQESR
jgi:hypothetical protein